jgi:hypothetical protein
VRTSPGQYRDLAVRYETAGWRELSSPYAPGVIDRRWAIASGEAASQEDCSICGAHGLYWGAFDAPADDSRPLVVVAYCRKCGEAVDWSWWQEPLT